MVSGMLALQIHAGRAHTSLELTETALREGTEVLPVDEISERHPELENSVKAAGFLDRWQAARPRRAVHRPAGEVADIARWASCPSPRGRTPVGLRLTGGRYVRAWARDSDALRIHPQPAGGERQS